MERTTVIGLAAATAAAVGGLYFYVSPWLGVRAGIAAAVVTVLITVLRVVGNRGFIGKPDPSKRAPRPVDSATARARLASKNVLVVGGTKGIGAAFARRLAMAGCHVAIAGRDRTGGAAVVSAMKAVAPDPQGQKLRFIPADLSTVKAAVDLAEHYRSTAAELDLLVFTVGILGTDVRELTPEGLEKEFQANFFCRFVLIEELAPLLEASSKKGPRSRILNIATAGVSIGTIDLNDLQYERKPYSGMNQHVQTVIANDLMCLDLAKRRPLIDTFCFNPGLLPTGIRNQMLPGLAGLFVENVVVPILGHTPDALARTTLITYAAAPELEGQSGLLVNPNGEPCLVDDVRKAIDLTVFYINCRHIYEALIGRGR